MEPLPPPLCARALVLKEVPGSVVAGVPAGVSNTVPLSAVGVPMSTSSPESSLNPPSVPSESALPADDESVNTMA